MEMLQSIMTMFFNFASTILNFKIGIFSIQTLLITVIIFVIVFNFIKIMFKKGG